MKLSYIASALAVTLTSASLFAQTLATVNGQALDSSVIDQQVAALRAADAKVTDTPRLRQMLTERQIFRTVLAQEAKRLKLDQNADFKKALANARADAARQGADKKPTFKAEWAVFEEDALGRAYGAHIAAQRPVSEKDVKAAYDEFAKRYSGTQEIRLGEILTKDRAAAEKAAAELKAKKDFVAVLKKYSVDEAAKKAGIPAEYVPLKDLQDGAPGLFPAVKDLKKGAHTAVLPNAGAFSVFYVADRRDIQVPAYANVKDSIHEDLQSQQIDTAIETLMNKANIKAGK